MVEAVEKIIDENIAIPTPAKFPKTHLLACQAVEDQRPPDEELPHLAKSRGGESLLGKNLIARWVRKRNRYDLVTSQLGIYEARRKFQGVELGPQGEYPNHQWEVDHTSLDLFVIDEEAQHVHGRPWLTVILDRYTRCIVGFSLSFAPASWISVADALRVAVADKTKLLAHINDSIGNEKYKIKESWDCHGIPTYLVTDHGREFKSRSMDQTLAILNTKPIQTKKRKPWLKGKVERWFRTFQEEFVHTIPGTTFSKFEKRKFYNSEEFAVVTLPELNWIVLKWVVDVYNQRPHGKLRLAPAEAWRRGVTETAPRKLPAALLRPTMGLVLDRVLGPNGVRFAGMRWDSTEFARLREQFKVESEAVQIRLDPRDLRAIYAWDDSDECWVKAHLVEPKEAGDYSLDQWYYIDTRRKELMKAEGLDKKKAVQQAVDDIQDFINEIANSLSSSKAYKRYLINVHRHRSAWEMLLPEEWDFDNDSSPQEHNLAPSPMLTTMQTGPYREPSRPTDDSDEQAEPPSSSAADTSTFPKAESNGVASEVTEQSQTSAKVKDQTNTDAPGPQELASKRPQYSKRRTEASQVGREQVSETDSTEATQIDQQPFTQAKPRNRFKVRRRS